MKLLGNFKNMLAYVEKGKVIPYMVFYHLKGQDTHGQSHEKEKLQEGDVLSQDKKLSEGSEVKEIVKHEEPRIIEEEMKANEEAKPQMNRKYDHEVDLGCSSKYSKNEKQNNE